jgi:hypothetical protein
MAVNIHNLSFPCGCESRKEIMTSGEWKRDAVIVGVVLLIALCIAGGKKLY